jgi:hypothetical protein
MNANPGEVEAMTRNRIEAPQEIVNSQAREADIKA